MTERGIFGVKKFLAPLTGLALFAVALRALRQELGAHSLAGILRELESLPLKTLILSFVLVILSYVVLTLYDLLALRYIGKPLSYRKTAFTSFVSYAVSNTVGLSFLSGAALRLRLYGSWGLSTLDIAQVTLFNAATLWVGLALGGGVALLTAPPPALFPLWGWRLAGGLLLTGAFTYLLWCVRFRREIRWKMWQFSPPSGKTAAMQFGVSLLDWTVTGMTLYILLPKSTISPLVFLGIFMTAQVAGLISHVPGGLGVFETVILVSLGGALPREGLAAALLAFRGLYYFIPLAAGVGMLGFNEIRQHANMARKTVGVAGRWLGAVTPTALSVLTFTGGLVLLISGATPAAGSRLAWLKHLLPLPFIEASHFIGSLAGTGLLLLAWGLHRRLDAARVATAVLAATGAVTSLLKGGDFEEAIFMVALLALLLPLKSAFYRRSRLMAEPLSLGWIAAVGLAVGGTAWLGFFSNRHVEYSPDLWWRFEWAGDAPRFLRALVATGGGLTFFGLLRLLRPSPPELSLPNEKDLDRAATVAAQSPSTEAWLAMLGDKEILFSESGNSFLMFAVEGINWVSMGDPVGNGDEAAELAWDFKGMADRHGGHAVFYEVSPERIPLYLDLGLQLLKLGEEARVPLGSFSLEGSSAKEHRYTVRKLEKDGLSFRLCSPEEVPAILPALKEVSDRWLEEKHTREKGFSLGFFKEDYLARFPVAVAERNGKIEAFANVWRGGGQSELSVDLMRHLPEAPRNVMDYLFIRMMVWGKEKGYGWFNLGMAPFSGFENRALAPLWHKLGGLLFRQGEHFYNFQGLRQFKDKFHPVWTPKYLASPGGLALPGILTNVSSLISRGLKGMVSK
jgi:phosphatidylglycerol lysyltransferase